MFYVLIVLAILGPTIFMWSFWHEHRIKGWNWINSEGRAMYVDAAKSLITASGVAVALAVTAWRENAPLATQSLRCAVICLITCIVASMVTILALSRGYERAVSREIDKGKVGDEGQLNAAELLFILIPAYFSLLGFLLGFIFLGRIAFQM